MRNIWWLMQAQRCCCRTAWNTNKLPLFSARVIRSGRGLRWAEPQPSESIAIIGIGGLGHLAVQYAKAAGFRTIAISHSTDKDQLIRELGADEIVRDGKSLAKLGGADVILGTGNSVEAMADSVSGLRPDGRLVVMGFENKPLPVHPGEPNRAADSDHRQPAERPRILV
jgi:D-arabinose 1-dehydrogenase-like Zn-dependent alcohol dehydrogenase